MNRIRRMLGSLREDGLFVCTASRIDRLFAVVRNVLISRKLGVARIMIGARCRLHGLSHIEMGEDFSAADSLYLVALTFHNGQLFSPRIVIGNHVRVSRNVQIGATHFVEIGDNVLIGPGVLITDTNHGQYSDTHSSPLSAPDLRPLDDNRRVEIGNNVWLGAGVVVMPNSFIGEGSVIGANSVVIGIIPPFSIAAGAPARVIKTFDFTEQKWISAR